MILCQHKYLPSVCVCARVILQAYLPCISVLCAFITCELCTHRERVRRLTIRIQTEVTYERKEIHFEFKFKEMENLHWIILLGMRRKKKRTFSKHTETHELKNSHTPFTASDCSAAPIQSNGYEKYFHIHFSLNKSDYFSFILIFFCTLIPFHLRQYIGSWHSGREKKTK